MANSFADDSPSGEGWLYTQVNDRQKVLLINCIWLRAQLLMMPSPPNWLLGNNCRDKKKMERERGGGINISRQGSYEPSTWTAEHRHGGSIRPLVGKWEKERIPIWRWSNLSQRHLCKVDSKTVDGWVSGKGKSWRVDWKGEMLRKEAPWLICSTFSFERLSQLYSSYSSVQFYYFASAFVTLW